MARVELAAEALKSLQRHDACLRERSPTGAKAVRADIERVALVLAEHPLAGPAVKGRPYRYFVTRRHRDELVYRVIGNVVEVLDVLHPRQSGPT